MAKKKKRVRINYSKIRGIMFLTFSILFMLTLLNKYNNVVVKAKQEIADLNEQKIQVEETEADLTEQLALLDNEDYVTTYAREHYVFKTEDETVAKISENN